MTSNLKPKPSRILVAVDGSDTSMKAADYAFTQAKNHSSDANDNNKSVEVFILNVIDLPPIFKLLPSETRKQLIRIGRQQANEIFDSVQEIAKSHGAKSINKEGRVDYFDFSDFLNCKIVKQATNQVNQVKKFY